MDEIQEPTEEQRNAAGRYYALESDGDFEDTNKRWGTHDYWMARYALHVNAELIGELEALVASIRYTAFSTRPRTRTPEDEIESIINKYKGGPR